MDTQLIRDRFTQEIIHACNRVEGLPMDKVSIGCAYWVSGIYRRVLGVDPAAAWKRRYFNRTNEDAIRVLGLRGFTQAVFRAANKMDWPMIAPQLAQPGDLALLRSMVGDVQPIRTISAGIYDGQLWMSRVNGGYGGFPHKDVLRAWRVV